MPMATQVVATKQFSEIFLAGTCIGDNSRETVVTTDHIFVRCRHVC
jgi:hypothetical protein